MGWYGLGPFASGKGRVTGYNIDVHFAMLSVSETRFASVVNALVRSGGEKALTGQAGVL